MSMSDSAMETVIYLIYLELGFKISNIVSKSHHAPLAGVVESEVSD